MKIKNNMARIHCFGPLGTGGEAIQLKPGEVSRELREEEEGPYLNGAAVKHMVAEGDLVVIGKSVKAEPAAVIVTPAPASKPVKSNDLSDVVADLISK